MITKPGYVLVGPTAEETHHCAGFEFNSQDELFDGCHMGQILPLLWAQKVLHDKVATLLAQPTSHGIEDGLVIHDDRLYPQTLGETFAAMMFYTVSANMPRESEQMEKFIGGAIQELENLKQHYIIDDKE